MSRKLLNIETSNLVCSFVWGCRANTQIIFPERLESGRGVGHVTPTICVAVRSAILATAWLLVD